MNPELQAQSDAICGAIRHLETTMHQDSLVAVCLICAMLLALMIVVFIRR
jgi:hypothetical protein